jgi:uncharacterized flavoprotein (TIGR03862 family)
LPCQLLVETESQVEATAVVIGAGPAGLMAAEVLAEAGVQVDVYDAMPSVARKFLLAGKGGLNITHSEVFTPFLARYGAAGDALNPILQAFDSERVRAWVHALGIETFVGTSGRVFPKEMKAAPLLRAWLKRLRAQGVRFHARHRWLGWAGDALQFESPQGRVLVHADTAVLALGGASWQRLGSDGAWILWLAARGIAVTPLQPSNCGFDVGWSAHLQEKCAGQPVKTVRASFVDVHGVPHAKSGELLLTATGVEGSLIYALSAPLRDAIAVRGRATLHLDLLPHKALAEVHSEVARPRGARSMASHLQSRLSLAGAKAVLLRECTSADDYKDPARLAAAIKALPLLLKAPRPIDEAISSAGGVAFNALDEHLMLRDMPGVFCAGEMLDWEAPTGGYLLSACFATGRAAGLGAVTWLKNA